MKKIFLIIVPAVLSMIGVLAKADHIAVVYCAIDARNEIRVLAADSPIGSKMLTSGMRGTSCTQVLHEFMSKGYTMTNTFSPATWRAGLLGYPLQVQGDIKEKKDGTRVELEIDWHPPKPGQVQSDHVLEGASGLIVFVLTHSEH